MRVYFEKPRTTVGWKGLINDPRLDDSFRINEGLRLARRILLEINELDAARGNRVSRHDHAAVHRRPDRLGRHRRAHDREPGASTARVRSVLPGRLQERHQRRREDRRRRDQGGLRAASLPVGDQGRSLGDRAHGRQRGLPHHPARRQDDQLRRGERRSGVRRTGARRPRRARDDRLLARQQPEAARTPGRRRARRRGAGRRAATRASAA